jgi:predicted nucleotidyltransferase
MPAATAPLPDRITQTLDQFVTLAQEKLGPDLRSLVLFGSAAENRLRATSDVNMLVVLSAWTPARADALREPLRTAQAAIALSPMFVLESELGAAAEAFAVKFSDILRRRRVLYGSDPFAGLQISRAAEITRVRQVLLNLLLRLRERYLMVSLREEQAARVLAQTAGPLRSAAATLLELQGHPAESPKAALESIAAKLPGAGWSELMQTLSSVREGQQLPAGVAPTNLLRLIDLAAALHTQAAGLT